ncbi:MAG: cytochrome c [Solirubrobacteraceae bacterium]
MSEGAHERRSMAATLVLLAVVVAAAIAGGIIVSLHNARDAPRNGPGGVKLTADEAQGRALFAQTCATCHTLAAVHAVGAIGPNLDVVRPAEAFVLYAIQNGFAEGSGQMPAGIYSGQEATDVAQFVAAVAGR